MENPANLNKLYYTITEVATMLKVNPSLLRFWEKEFDMIRPKKNKKGTRYYTKEDIELINKIYELVKDKGYTLEGAKKMLISKEPLPYEPAPISKTDLIKKLSFYKEQLIAISCNF